MLTDLLMLAVLGALLEGIATALSGMALQCPPSFTISFLVLFVAIARWNLWGLTIAPILVVGTIIGGKNNFYDVMAAMYDWRLYVSALVGLLTLGLNVIIFKKNGTKKSILNNWLLVVMILCNYLIYNLIQGATYWLCTRDVNGQILYDTGKKVINICQWAINGYAYNLMGLAFAFVGVIILRSQGVVNNVYDKLVDDKKNAELQRQIENGEFDFGESDEAKTDKSLDTEELSEN